MLHIKQSIPGVYELSTGTSTPTNVKFGKFRDRLLADPHAVLRDNLTELKSILEGYKAEHKEESIIINNIADCNAVDCKAVDCKAVRPITETLSTLHNIISAAVEKNPLLLFSECTADYCPLSRSRSRIREIFELCTSDVIGCNKNICSVGPGYLFQEVVLFSDQPARNFNLVIVDDQQEYIQCVSQDADFKEISVEPTTYHGRVDNNYLARARWVYMHTARYSAFLNWFAALGYNAQLTLCTSAVAYKALVSASAADRVPTVILGVDLIDDYAEQQLTAFYSAALATNAAYRDTPPLALCVSKNFIDIFKPSPMIIPAEPLVKQHKRYTQTLSRYSDVDLGIDVDTRYYDKIEKKYVRSADINLEETFAVEYTELEYLMHYASNSTSIMRYNRDDDLLLPYMWYFIKGMYSILSDKRKAIVKRRITTVASITAAAIVGIAAVIYKVL